MKLKTLQDLIDEGLPLNRPIILIDPDTYWILAPTFNDDGEHICIMADYGDRLEELEK